MDGNNNMFEAGMTDGVWKVKCKVCGRVTRNRGSMRMHCVMVHGHDVALPGPSAGYQAKPVTVVPDLGIADCSVALNNADGQPASCRLEPKSDVSAQILVSNGASDSAVATSTLGDEQRAVADGTAVNAPNGVQHEDRPDGIASEPQSGLVLATLYNGGPSALVAGKDPAILHCGDNAVSCGLTLGREVPPRFGTAVEALKYKRGVSDVDAVAVGCFVKEVRKQMEHGKHRKMDDHVASAFERMEGPLKQRARAIVGKAQSNHTLGNISRKELLFLAAIHDEWGSRKVVKFVPDPRRLLFEAVTKRRSAWWYNNHARVVERLRSETPVYQ